MVFASIPGPLVSSLVTKLGARAMLTVAAVLLILGQALTSLATEIWQPFLAYSTMIGISVCIVYTVSWGVLPLYFQKRRSLACGVVSSGKFLGIACVGPLSRISMKQYGWRPTLQLFSSLGVVMLILAILYRPPKKVTEVEQEKQTEGIRQLLAKTLALHKNLQFTFWLWMVALMYLAFLVPSYHIVG